MTAEEKSLMTNPEHKPLMDLPPVTQHLMQANIPRLLVLLATGEWSTLLPGTPLYRGAVYVVAPSAPITPPPVQYRQYPVFCGSDRIYKADLTRPNSDAKRIYHLHTVTGMAEFAGIRYRGSQEWRARLEIATYGEPVEVRFVIR